MERSRNENLEQEDWEKIKKYRVNKPTRDLGGERDKQPA